MSLFSFDQRVYLKTKRLLYGFFVLLFFFCLTPKLHKTHAALVPGKNLEVRAHHTGPNGVRLASVEVKDGPAGQYAIIMREYGYTVFINADSNLSLFRGIVPAYYVSYRDPATGPAQPPIVEGPINPLVFNIPYYDDARFVKMLDPTNRVVLTVDLHLFGINAQNANAPRLTDCNACGYCRPDVKPDNLDACMACIYPNMTPDESLMIDKDTNRPRAPAAGKYYTQIGCIGSGATNFRQAAAQGEVLNYLMFRFLIPTSGVIALLALIYGAFLLVTSRDNPEQIQRGKSWVYGAIIGAIFVFAAVLMIQTIAINILKIPGFS